MVLERTKGLARDDISDVQIQMLSSGQIPQLLPLQIQEIDFDVKLRYEIRQARMLPYELKARKLTPGDAILFLTGIVNILSRSTEYMLHEQRYLLHERLLFIREDWGDVWLTYIPGTIEELPPLREQLEKLLTLLIQTLEENQQSTSDVRKLKSLCHKDDWTLPAMAEQLESMRMNAYLQHIGIQEEREVSHLRAARLADQPETKTGNDTAQDPSIRSDKSYSEANLLHSEANANSVQSVQKAGTMQAKPQEESAFIPLQDGWWELVEEEEPRTKSRFTIQVSSKTAKMIIYILLAASFVVWLQTAVEPAQGWIYASVAMVFLLLIATLAVRQVLFNHNSDEQTQETDPSKDGKHDLQAQPEVKSQPLQQEKTEARTQMEHSTSTGSQKPNPELDSYYDRLSANTTLLSAQDAMATTWLGNRAADQTEIQPLISTKKPRPSLELEQNGEVEQVRIQQFPFLIGRDEANVHLSVQTPDISRIHVEICETPDGYAIRDLESRNGTTLNEKALVPYESYPLSDRDVLGLVSVRMIFKTG